MLSKAQCSNDRVHLIVIVLAMIVMAIPAVAQSLSDPYAVMRNGYIEAKLGIRDATDPWPRVDNVAGRFSMGSTGGDPESLYDDYAELTYDHYIIAGSDPPDPGMPHDVWCWTTVNIADINWLGVFGDDGIWITDPTVGPSGGYIRSSFLTDTGNVRVDLRMDLCRDTVRWTYTLVNQDTVTHSVGLRVGWDEHGQAGSNMNGTSCNTIPYVPGLGAITQETEFVGTAVPEWIEHRDFGIPEPWTITRHMFRDPSYSGSTERHITPPDRVVIGEQGLMSGTLWDYRIGDRTPYDTYTYAYWNPLPLAPKQSRTILVYFGLASATSDLRNPYVLAVQGPRALKYDSSSTSSLTPDPFKITSYMYNLYSDVDISDCSLFLTLPAGLEFVAGESATKSIAVVKAQQEGQVFWQVKPTGEYAGNLTYFVTASGAGVISKTVPRSVAVPSTLKTRIHPEWQMFSVPFQLSNTFPDASLHVPSGTLELLRYDPSAGDYAEVSAVKPGDGFWVRNTGSGSQSQLLTLTGATALDGNFTYQVPLSPGWNQFGNPFIYDTSWGRVRVLKERTGTDPVSVAEAVSQGWIKSTVYWWDVGSHSYQRDSSAATSLAPWVGYWVKALVPCKLIIPVVDHLGSQISSSTTLTSLATRSADSAIGDGWKVQVVAKAGDAASGKAVAGVTSRASDGYSAEDIETPPLMPDFVSVSFPHNDWGVNSGRYVEEFKKSDGLAKSWDMEVSTDKLNTDVVLTWPDLSRVPKDYGLKLVDIDGNVTRYLRTTSSYRYNTGNSTVRRFKLVADTNKSGRLRISGLTVMPTRSSRGATISYTLSSDAVARVRILRGAGKTVRSLAANGSVSRGIASQSWDYRDNSGNDVAPGPYLIEVKATTPEGETAKMVTSLVIPR